jgi:hypothetical protein
MSWSFSVPAGPSGEFTDRANQAKATLEAASENNDYGLTQLASGQADEAIKAAQAVITSGVLGDGNVSASLAGHHATDDKSASSISIALSCTPVPSAS